jgi:hypothetical protein
MDIFKYVNSSSAPRLSCRGPMYFTLTVQNSNEQYRTWIYRGIARYWPGWCHPCVLCGGGGGYSVHSTWGRGRGRELKNLSSLLHQQLYNYHINLSQRAGDATGVGGPSFPGNPPHFCHFTVISLNKQTFRQLTWFSLFKSKTFLSLNLTFGYFLCT